MRNPQTYLNHQLNTSKSKEAHIFPKSTRFSLAPKMNTQALYQLPSTNSKRSCSFGLGSKVDLVLRRCSPPPNSYKCSSEFEKKEYQNVPSLGYGRENVKFGSFIYEAIRQNRDVPSPDRYNFKPLFSTIGGKISERVNTEPDLRHGSNPGPGTYKVACTEMKQTGSYILSHFKNHISPRLIPQLNKIVPKSKDTRNYNIEDKERGKCVTSKFKNLVCRTFAKSKRPGLEDRSKLDLPGFKQTLFSEFGTNC